MERTMKKLIKLTKYDLLTAFLCLLAIIPGLLVYNKLPEQVPRHFDINGNPDGYSGRLMVVVGLPLLVTFLHLIGCIIMNHDKRQDNAGKLKELVRLVTPTILYVVQAFVLLYSLDRVDNIVTWTALLCAVLLIAIGNYLPKAKPNGSIGIRTPATMSSEVVWRKAHRFGGKVSVIIGMLMIPCAVMELLVPVIILFALFVLIPVIYAETCSDKES